MSIKRPGLEQINGSGAAVGQTPVWNGDVWVPGAAGVVTTIVPGTNVTVDNTDPTHPVVAAVSRELLMADGVTSPPVPLETEAGDDWLYQD